MEATSTHKNKLKHTKEHKHAAQAQTQTHPKHTNTEAPLKDTAQRNHDPIPSKQRHGAAPPVDHGAAGAARRGQRGDHGGVPEDTTWSDNTTDNTQRPKP